MHQILIKTSFGNAIKAPNPRLINVEPPRSRTSDFGLVVSDNGIGISAQKPPLIGETLRPGAERPARHTAAGAGPVAVKAWSTCMARLPHRQTEGEGTVVNHRTANRWLVRQTRGEL